MASKVSICSNALLLLGAKPISSLSQAGDHPTLCSNLYDSVRDDILRLHTWNCATKRVILAPLTETPDFDWDYQFQLPGDWLRTIQVGYIDQKMPYRSEGQRLLANETVLPFVYIFRNEVESSWSVNLVHVMELAMAAKMAYPVTKSTSVRDSMRDELGREFKVAKAIDGQDDPPEEFDAGSFLESRQ